MSFSNVEDEIIIIDPEGRVVDEVYYTLDFPYGTGASMYVQDLLSNNNMVFNWAVSTTSYGIGDIGTPGEPSTNLSSTIRNSPANFQLHQLFAWKTHI